MPITNSIAATKLHIKCVMNDAEFLDKRSKLPRNHPEIGKMYINLLKEYGLEWDDMPIQDTELAEFLGIDYMFSAGSLKYDLSKGVFTSQFDVSITKRQFDELWKLVNKQKKKYNLPIGKNKIRGPENPELLYAVFKARRRKETFKLIFEKLHNGKLEDYDKSSLQFATSKELENYYRKYYKPSL